MESLHEGRSAPVDQKRLAFPFQFDRPAPRRFLKRRSEGRGKSAFPNLEGGFKTINPETPDGAGFVSFGHVGASFRHSVLEPEFLDGGSGVALSLAPVSGPGA